MKELICWSCSTSIINSGKASREHICQQCGAVNMTQVQCAASPLGRFDLVMMGEHLKVEKITHDILPLDKKPNSEDKLLWAGMKRIKISKQMTSTVEHKDENWVEFLEFYNMWDERLPEDELYLRYQKFSVVEFPEAPDHLWKGYFADLLQFERGLVFGDAIGEVTDFEFRPDVVNEQPIREKPIPYARHEREWIRGYMSKLEELGVVKQLKPGEPEPLFTVGVVLVREGQSQQDYRMCANLVAPNNQTREPTAPLPDIMAACDELQGYKYKSALDIKAGYFNVKIAKEYLKYAGIITQDGLFQVLRMIFGFKSAPSFFQMMMLIALARARWKLKHGTFQDDCTVAAMLLAQCWQDTLEAIRCLLTMGLPINIWKCKFLRTKIDILGLVLEGDKFSLGKKALAKLFTTKLPRTLKQLQSVIGKLNHCSPFVVGYKQKVKPLIDLLGKAGQGKWRQQHTEALNVICEQIFCKLKLQLVNQERPLKLHVDAGEEGCTVVLAHSNTEICAFAGRYFTATEARCPVMIKLFIAALWGYKRYRRYCDFCSDCTIVMPLNSEVIVATQKAPTACIQAMLIELSSLGVKFSCGDGAWALEDNLLQATQDQQEEASNAPIWQHEDINIKMPCLQRPAEASMEADYILSFDGAFSKGKGAGGVLLLDSSAKCHGGRALFFDTQVKSNNQAEAQALIEAVQFVQEELDPPSSITVLVKGDSQLVINVMKRVYKAKSPALVHMYTFLQQAFKQSPLIQWRFLHVPREQNQWADYLSQVANALQNTYTLQEVLKLTGTKIQTIKQPKEALPMLPEASFASFAGVDGETVACATCGLEDLPSDLHFCGGCLLYFHLRCLHASNAPSRPGPWYCNVCKHQYVSLATSDITLDETVLRYLATSTLPQDPMAAKRALKVAKFMYIDSSGRLWFKATDKFAERQVPLLGQRKKLIDWGLKSLAYPSGEKLFFLLREQYFWIGMRHQCEEAAARSTPRVLELAKYKQPPYLYPTEKGDRPFSVWAVDTIVGLKPPAPNGGTHIMVCVDPFSKWVELAILPELDSTNTASWFYDEIVCRYGVPSVVRSDQGREYCGDFKDMLARLGVKHRPIATMWPRANGQAERYVALVKSGIRKLCSSCEQGVHWWDILPEVARGLRHLPHRATKYSPYVIVFGQQPKLPLIESLQGRDDLVLDEPSQEDCIFAEQVCKDLYAKVKKNLTAYDRTMTRQYLRKRTLAAQDVRFCFAPGQQVIMKQKRPGSTKIRSLGPYTFESYGGKLGVNATIISALGKRYFVSAANLLPFRGSPTIPPIEEADQDSDEDLSGGSDAPPSGAIVLEEAPRAPQTKQRLKKTKGQMRFSRRRKKPQKKQNI